jgi:hypothetical protein
MHARLQGAGQAETRHLRGPSVAVRGKPTESPAVLTTWTLVRYVSVDPATQRSTARQGDTPRDTEETAHVAAYPQPAGRFRRWWQVLGSNQRRRSRRFYSPILLFESYAADLHLCLSRWDLGWPPSAIRPWTPGSGVRAVDRPSQAGPRMATDQPTDGGGKGHGRGSGSGHADRPRLDSRSDLPFQDAGSMSPASSSPGSSSASWCREPRRCADWRRSPGRRCSRHRYWAGMSASLRASSQTSL